MLHLIWPLCAGSPSCRKSQESTINGGRSNAGIHVFEMWSKEKNIQKNTSMTKSSLHLGAGRPRWLAAPAEEQVSDKVARALRKLP